MDLLLTYIVQHIVHHPDQVEVEAEETSDGLNLHLSVHPEDMGVVIGKDGSIARSLRNLLRASAIKQNQRVHLNIVDTADASNAE